MRVLLLCDDYWHPGQVPIDGVEPLKAEGFTFDIITDAKDFSPGMLKDYPAVLLSKCDEVSAADKTPWKTNEVQQAFIAYVENGGGLLAVHTALVAGEHTEALDKLIGCRFVYHPHDCPVTVQPVKPHPVTEGVGMFCEVDEHYRLEVLSPDTDIIMASYSPPQGEAEKYAEDPYNHTPAWICPAGTVRTQGKGRICVLSPGHHLPVWHNPQYQKALANALRWVGNVTPR
ncbi:MAG: ThuA domain-containing protein [Oscillospiraceae bacterium]|jgi:type 1 glutamine amidotransferase|nr:ThuA domain-containing protein [Oscillospiraceae bacterium]